MSALTSNRRAAALSTICRRRVTCVDTPTPYRTVFGQPGSQRRLRSVDCQRPPYTSKLPELVEAAIVDVPDVLVHRQFTVSSDAEVTNFVQRRHELVFNSVTFSVVSPCLGPCMTLKSWCLMNSRCYVLVVIIICGCTF